MIRAAMTPVFAACALFAANMLPAHAGRVVADLSQSNVSITSGFHGTELLLFGAVDGQDTDDIIVVINGPPTDIAQHRKAKVAGIWINVEIGRLPGACLVDISCHAAVPPLPVAVRLLPVLLCALAFQQGHVSSLWTDSTKGGTLEEYAQTFFFF